MKALAGPAGTTYYAGPENRLAAAAVGNLLESDPPSGPSPLVLVGPPGCGKSLLAKGVAERRRAAAGEEAVLLASGVDLRRQLERAIGAERREPGAVEALEERLAGLALLVVEDLEGLAASAPAVRLLTTTLDRLEQRGGRLLATAGRPLGEIVGLDRQLVSRLAGGLVVEVAAPAEAARQALLVAALSQRGCRIDSLAAADLAAWAPADPRRIAALAERLHARYGVRAPISRRQSQAFIADAAGEDTTPLADLVTTVAKYYRMPVRQLRSSSRKAPVVLARAVAIYLARRLTPLSYDEIGRYLGGRDHTTVMHNFRRIDGSLASDRALRSAIDDLLRKLGRTDASPTASEMGS